jgi:hypothetical protein
MVAEIIPALPKHIEAPKLPPESPETWPVRLFKFWLDFNIMIENMLCVSKTPAALVVKNWEYVSNNNRGQIGEHRCSAGSRFLSIK